jgi:hypothetical protein
LWNGTTYTTSGLKTFSTLNALGCDSTATLNLTINNSTTSSQTATACDNYLWNGTTYTTSGLKTFSTLNAVGCDSTATLNLTINPLPLAPTVGISGTQLISSAATAYQWYLDTNLIVGANAQIYDIVLLGTYSVCITDANGCTSCSSEILITGLTENESNNFSFVPVPFNDQLNITLPINAITNNNTCINIYDASWRLVYSQLIKETQTILTTTTWERGIYFISINNANGVVKTGKVLKIN